MPRTRTPSLPRRLPRASGRPTYLEPMKALGVDQVPAGSWRCELKFDGYRAIAVLEGKEVGLWSRTQRSMTADYPEVVAGLRGLGCPDAVLDGEIVALDAAGRSHFQLLQNRGQAGVRPPIVFFAFDLLRREGADLTGLPLEERQRLLAALVKKPVPGLQLSPWFDVAPAELLAEAKRQGMEGIVAKRLGSAYEPGRRSGAWLKCKLINEQEFVIGGFTPPQRSRAHFGAILVGYHEAQGLRYAGKVGTGFAAATLESLHARFLANRRTTCPFVDLPSPRRPRFGQGMGRAEMAKVTWLRPALVAQIKFAEWTGDHLLRQPVFLGLRTDKRAREVRREVPVDRKKSVKMPSR